VTSKKRNNQFTNKAAKKPESLLKPFLMLYYFLLITLKNIFSLAFSFKDLLELVN